MRPVGCVRGCAIAAMAPTPLNSVGVARLASYGCRKSRPVQWGLSIPCTRPLYSSNTYKTVKAPGPSWGSTPEDTASASVCQGNNGVGSCCRPAPSSVQALQGRGLRRSRRRTPPCPRLRPTRLQVLANASQLCPRVPCLAVRRAVWGDPR